MFYCHYTLRTGLVNAEKKTAKNGEKSESLQGIY